MIPEGKIIIDCGSSSCTPQPWQDPVTVIQGPFYDQWWIWVIATVILLAAILATAIVRYRAHERKEEETKRRLQAQVDVAENHKSCSMCGHQYKPEVK